MFTSRFSHNGVPWEATVTGSTGSAWFSSGTGPTHTHTHPGRAALRPGRPTANEVFTYVKEGSFLFLGPRPLVKPRSSSFRGCPCQESPLVC